MRIRYFTQSAYDDLFDSVSNNRAKDYYKKTSSWIADYLKGKKYFNESAIDAILPTLTNEFGGKESDLINIRSFYDAFRSKLSPKQASEVKLWSYLAHTEYWKYAIERWDKKEDKTEENIKQRFFCGSYKGSRIGLLRNAVSRLWWIGYLSYQEDKKNPYILTELLLSHSDLCQSIIERNFSMNKEISIGILNAIKEINEDPKQEDVVMAEWQNLCKYINRYGAVCVLDLLSRDEIKVLSREYILKLRKVK